GRGGGPTLVNAECVRLTAHTSDDQESVYRSMDEIAAARQLDPIVRARVRLIRHRLWSSEQDEQLVTDMKADVDGALERASLAADPDPHTLARHVYDERPGWPHG